MKVISGTLGLALLAGITLTTTAALAADLPADMQAKVDAKIPVIQALAADPVIVNAVKEHNASPTDADMTQDKWKSLNILDPIVRNYSKNAAGQFLKSKKDETMTEGFISGADGTKVAFLSKPTNWSHKGKAKHDEPMAGKTWQGPMEVDESTGLQEVQVAVPVLDGGKPIGSLVIGLSIAKLK